VLIDAGHGIDLLVVNRPKWYLSLKLQKLLLKIRDRLRPLLKLDILRLHMVLKVDDPMVMDIHLLTGDVEQHTSAVPSMLGLTNTMVSSL
jgi:hypothetical protein